MSTNVADLGLRVRSEDVGIASNRLDGFVEKAVRAERATDSLAAATMGTGGVIAQMIASIERQMGALVELQRAQQGAGAMAGQLAAAEQAAAIAHDRAAVAADKVAAATKASAVASRGAASAAEEMAGEIARVNAVLATEATVTMKAANAQEQAIRQTRAYSQATQDLDGHVQAFLAHQGRLGPANDNAAKSMKAVQYAGLNMSRQFADIGTQLAGGQSPFLILAQQGPQIADIFAQLKAEGIGFKTALGGIGAEAAKVLAPLAGFGGVASGVAVIVTAATIAVNQYQEALVKQQQTASGLGRISGLSGGDLEASAKAIQSSSNTSIQAAREMANAYATAGVTSVGAIKDLGQVTKDLGVTMQLSGDQARDYVAGAMRDPTKAAEDLQAKLGLLNGSQMELIQNMQAAGDKAGAQRVLMDALKDATSGAADRTAGFAHDVGILTAQLGTLWDGLGQVIARYQQLSGMNPYAAMAKQQAAEQAKVDAARGVVGRLNQAVTNAGNLNLDGSDGRQQIGNQITAKTGGYYGALGTGDLETASRLQTEIKALTRAKETYLAPAERAAELADLEVKAATAKTAAQKVDIAQQRERLNLAGQAVTQAEAVRRVTDAGRVALAQANAAEAKKGAGAAGRALRADNRGDNAIEQAKAAELSAQMATTRNVETIAGLKAAQIAQELKGQEVRLLGQVKAKEISQNDADTALSSYRKAASYKQEAASRDAARAIANRDMAVAQETLGYSQRVAQLRAAGATSLEEAGRIQAENLAEQQAADRDAYAQKLGQRVADNDITDLKSIELYLAKLKVQGLEEEEQQRQRRLAIFQRDLDLARQASQNEVDMLSSRQGLAQSAYEAGQVERRIMAIRYQAERAEKVKIAENTKLDADIRASALARIPVLDEIYRNELRQLELSDNAVTAYADLVGALSNAARSVIDGDIGGSISAASGVLKQLSGLAGGLGTSLGGALGSAAAYAGPIGAAVSAVTGVLGAIGDRSAAKAEKKIAELTKAVDDLRAENKTGSGSIAAALAEANSSWNADLEYSSAMLDALRSIDAKTGAVAALVARQISTGSLLGTSGLGLGSSSSMGGLGGGLSGGLVGGIAGAGLGAAATAATGLLMSGFAGTAAALAGPFGLAVGAAAALVKALTKTKTTTEVLDQGLQFAASSFGDISANGVTGSSYADLLTTTKKSLLGIGLSTKVKTSTVSGSIDGDLLGQISGVVQALGDGVLASASVFGIEAAKAAESALGSAVVDLGKLSLKDLKPDEIAAVLNATFDKVGDQLAAAGVPGLNDLADVGEGAFETLTRLAREYQVVDVSLAAIGKTFGQVGLESIAARDNLVQLFDGLDAFTSSTSFFAQNFLTDAERLAPIQKAVNDNLKAYGLTAESSRDQFKALVLAQDLSTEAGRSAYAALLAAAPAFDKVATSIEDATQRAADAAAQLAKDIEAAAAKAVESQQRIDAYLQGESDKKIQAAADAQSALTGQMTAFADSADRAAHSLDGAIKSLTDFADSLKAELGLGTTGGGLQQARSAFNTAVATGNTDAIPELGRAYADAVKSEGSRTEYLQALAQIRMASLNSATSAKSSAYQSSLSKQLSGAYYLDDDAMAAEIRRLKAAGLPAAANGGSFTVGGYGGVDNNMLSINGVPKAAVNQGEVVSITPPGRSSNDNGEIAALRAQVARLEAVLIQIAGSTAKTATHTGSIDDNIDGVTEGGTAMKTEKVA